MPRKKMTWEEYTKTERYLKSVKAVNCYVCGHEYHVDANDEGSKEDYVCRKSCLDKLETVTL